MNLLVILGLLLFPQHSVAAPIEQIKEEKILTIEEKIVQEAIKRDYSPEKALAIANAESRFKNVPNFKYDGEDGYYTAYGIFQITRTTYKHFCGNPDERLDVDKNIECALKILSQGGESHWNESRHVWGLHVLDK